MECFASRRVGWTVLSDSHWRRSFHIWQPTGSTSGWAVWGTFIDSRVQGSSIMPSCFVTMHRSRQQAAPGSCFTPPQDKKPPDVSAPA